MKIPFQKYQATGNDFILIDNRSGNYSFSTDQIKRWCHRKFGIGADGLILIEKHPSLDFNVNYYNSDGSQSLCGNGSRAAVKMAASLGMASGKTRFNAYDGSHEAELLDNDVVKFKLNDVKEIKSLKEDVFLHTGSPHHIRFVTSIKDYPVFNEGRQIRNSDPYQPGGTNVNFVEVLDNNEIFVRTYERGVEDETLSCGTGVTAAALASSLKGYKSPISIQTLGGKLLVEFKIKENGQKNGHFENNPSGLPVSATFSDIFLIGPAKMVFEGQMEL